MHNISMKQIFLKKEAQFFLGKPKSSKPTTIFLIIRINGIQFKISTHVKVFPSHWIHATQEACISNKLSEIDNYNNNIANKQLEIYRNRFNDFKNFILSNPQKIVNCKEILMSYIKIDKRMRRTRKDDKKVDLISYLKTEIRKGDKRDSTKNNYLRFIDRFEEFLKTKKEYELNSPLFKEFQDWCINNIRTQCGNKVSSNTVNEIVKNVLSIIKNYAVTGGIVDKTIIDNIMIKPLKSHETNDKIALMDDEITLLYNYKCKDPKDEEIKDLFLLECTTGQRISDIDKIANNIETKNDRTYINLVQDKGVYKIEVDIIFQMALDIIKKYNYNLPTYDRYTYNKRIKLIARKAGIKGKEIITKQEAGQSEVKQFEKERWELISSHVGRCTFVTLLSLRGFHYNEISRYTGHRELKMVQLYDKSKTGTKIKRMFDDLSKSHPEKILKLIGNSQSAESTNKAFETTFVNDIDEAKKVLNFLGEDVDNYIHINDIGLLIAMIGRKESKVMEKLGIDNTITIKEIFNSYADPKEQKNALHKLYEMTR